MSKGHGKTQRFVLEQLDELATGDEPGIWIRALTLARRMHGESPTAAQREGMRRALRRLSDDGEIEVVHHRQPDRPAAEIHTRIPKWLRNQAAERRASRT
jgi:hypothetical protein